MLLSIIAPLNRNSKVNYLTVKYPAFNACLLAKMVCILANIYISDFFLTLISKKYQSGSNNVTQ